MTNTPELFTTRLRLRRFQDMAALYRILSDTDTNRFLPWMPARNIDDARNFFAERYAAVYRQDTGYAWAICLKDSNLPIGYLKADTRAPYDLGYGLHRDYWHQGLATEAAQAVIKQIKCDRILPYLTATHDRNNPNSGKVMQKIGMTYQYSYEEQWQPKDILVTFRLYQLNLVAPDIPPYQGYKERYAVHFVEQLP